MAGYLSMKMKRKDLEEVNDDFSNFSLSSPAKKIRRLDTDLAPIMEEKEPEVPFSFKQLSTGNHIPSSVEQIGCSRSFPIEEELPTVTENEERALVLFKPMNTPLLICPSNRSISVTSDVISGIKNQFIWSLSEDEEERQGLNTTRTNESLAIVPWVPSQFPSTQGTEVSQTESMESDDLETATMDIDNTVAGLGQGWELSGTNSGFHSNQWKQQQQHCMIPQLSQNTPSHVAWFR